MSFIQQPALEAWGYLVLLMAAELVTNLGDPRWGLALYAVLLIALLIHTTLRWEHPVHRLLLSLTLVPLIRLLSLSLPLTRFPQIDWYLFTSLPLFVMAFMVMRSLGLTGRAVGLTRRGLPVQVAIGLTGLALGYAEYLILSPQPLIQELGWPQVWLPALILLVSTGLLEELLFRGILQRTALDALGAGGLAYVAALFAILHVGHRSELDIAFVFGVGIFFGWAVVKTGSILGVTLSHGLTNIMLFLVIPLLAGPASVTVNPAPPPTVVTPAAPTQAVLAPPTATATRPAPLPTLAPRSAPSPDGRWRVTTGEAGREGTWLVATDGGQARQFSPTPLTISWAPNSLGYAYADEGVVYAIGLSPSSQPLQIAHVEPPARIVPAAVAWAPVGDQIAFEVDEGNGEATLRVVSSAGGPVRTLERGKAQSLPEGTRAIQWGADATELVWTVVNPARRVLLRNR